MDSPCTRFMLQAASRELRPKERVAYCLRSLAWNPGTKRHYTSVEVWLAEEVHRAHYKNLFTCGSVWQCPVCAAKISERRRVELSKAVSAWDGGLYLISLTFRHDRADDLKKILDEMVQAYRLLHSGRVWQDFVASFGIVGTIRALEVTWSDLNGFHPHLHLLLFSDVLAKNEIARFFREEWDRSLGEFGLDCDDHGVSVKDSDSMIGDYVAKWGHGPKDGRGWNVEHEVTKANQKRGRAGGLTPLDFLMGFAESRKKSVRRKMGRLWVEYCKAFKGRNQLVWSRGLRGRLGMGRELSDQELAAAALNDSVFLARLSLEEWRRIVANDARGEVLEIASSGDVERLREFVEGLGGSGA